MSHLQKILGGKHLLLDTCVLVDFHKYQESPELQEFFQGLDTIKCSLLTIDQVRCEFIKFAKNKQEYQDLFEWLDNFVPDVLFPSKEDLYRSNQIYLALKGKDAATAQNVSLEDLLLGSMLMKWPSDVFLATINHKDFPTWLYDRKAVCAFDDRAGQMRTVGVYGFSVEKYKKLIMPFE